MGLRGLADSPCLSVALFGAVATGALAGDHVGYALGRRFGPRMAGWRIVEHLGTDRWVGAMARIERRGSVAVFVSRMVSVARSVMPAAAAGAAGLTYPRFLLGAGAGALLWSGVRVGAGLVGGELLRAVSPLS